MKKRKLYTGVSRSVSIYDTRAYRISLYRNGIWGDDTGKGVQFSLGNAYEPADLCGKRTVPCGQLLCSGVSLLHVIFMEFMLNIRHIFYGLSLLERFGRMGKKRLYMIFSLTDETYSLFFVTKVPPDVREDQFLFAIALLDQSYWIIGSGIGALLGNILPFSTEGIDFAMTALFVVIMTEQWMERQNRKSVMIGLFCGLFCLIIFGADNFILPTMICIMVILLAGKRILAAQPDAQCVGENDKPENSAKKIAGQENGESGKAGFVGLGSENGNEREVNQNAG